MKGLVSYLIDKEIKLGQAKSIPKNAKRKMKTVAKQKMNLDTSNLT